MGQSACMSLDGADGAQLLRTDVERFCAELVNHPPAVRLRSLAALRAMLDEVMLSALAVAMTSAREEGVGLRRIAKFSAGSHEQVRRILAAAGEANAPEGRAGGDVHPADPGVR